MTGVGWYSQQISLNFLNLVKFYICKPKSTGRGSLIKKQTTCIFGTYTGLQSNPIFIHFHVVYILCIFSLLDTLKPFLIIIINKIILSDATIRVLIFQRLL
jgi:hypothetical protein